MNYSGASECLSDQRIPACSNNLHLIPIIGAHTVFPFAKVSRPYSHTQPFTAPCRTVPYRHQHSICL